MRSSTVGILSAPRVGRGSLLHRSCLLLVLGAEPKLRRLMWEFSGELEFRWVMGGLARSYGTDYRDDEGSIGSGPSCFADLMSPLARRRRRRPGCPPTRGSGPRTRSRAPTRPAWRSRRPASRAREPAYRYLRRVREGIFVERRKLDHADALAAEAGAGRARQRALQARPRLARDHRGVRRRPRRGPRRPRGGAGGGQGPPHRGPRAGQHALGGVHRRRRRAPRGLGLEAAGGLPRGGAGRRRRAGQRGPAGAAGGDRALRPRSPPRRRRSSAGAPSPVVCAELWSLAKEWKLRPVRALTGTIWEKA